MLAIVISISNDGVKELLSYKGKPFEICDHVSKLIMECIIQCVFGEDSSKIEKLTFIKNGNGSKYHPGDFLKACFEGFFFKNNGILRQSTDLFNQSFLGAGEKELLANAQAFREFISKMIDKRRSEMQRPDFVNSGDFLTMLL